MRKLIIIIAAVSLAACGGKGNKNSNIQQNTNNQIDSNKVVTEVIDEAPVSPKKRTTGYINGVKTIVQWGSPSVKGRDVWGLTVPYGEVWRAGANEATSMEFDKDVLLNGKELKAGKYGFFLIPMEGEWTVIFNSVWEQWGSFEYDEKTDVLRFKVTPQASEHSETLEYKIEKDGVAMSWEKLTVRFTVKAK